jgi:hypothetical protein
MLIWRVAHAARWHAKSSLELMKANTLKPDEFVDVAAFHRPSHADSFKSDLAAAGMEPRLKDERKLQRFWFMAPQKAGLHVQVPGKFHEQAEKMLEERRHHAEKAIHCPSCGSSRVQYPALTRKNILPAFAGWILAVLHLTQHKYYCEDCHYTWPQPKADTRPTQILE